MKRQDVFCAIGTESCSRAEAKDDMRAQLLDIDKRHQLRPRGLEDKIRHYTFTIQIYAPAAPSSLYGIHVDSPTSKLRIMFTIEPQHRAGPDGQETVGTLWSERCCPTQSPLANLSVLQLKWQRRYNNQPLRCCEVCVAKLTLNMDLMIKY